MWQICGYIPQTILPAQPDVTQKAAQLATSFFIETFIHAKEKVSGASVIQCATDPLYFYILFELLVQSYNNRLVYHENMKFKD